ncbi:alcohol dehydrogenase catalytic domain-containing protein [Nocardioides sp. Root190]|uniref:alcohol dehydrogenase catalytic domain-containing protein n=1 Tax=Nocardioides sp. Root190 TaxID=1736488 RepID=UPI001F2D0414|nr:alcohol dehydrogenase catalytic domain-containing protein [Nocardioides sp. Root190]
MSTPGGTMAAWRLTAYGAPVSLQEVPVPVPAEGEVLLEVTAVGLCHSDVHLLDSPEPMAFDVPFTLGHEVAGTVVAAPGDPALVGRAVVVHGVWACGTCDRCRSGRTNYCTGRGRAVGGGIGRDGGLARYAVVPVGSVVDATGLAPEVAAPLTDGGLTSYHAVATAADRLPASGGRVVVIGVGGLGHLAVQVLRATTAAQVLATDTHPPALDLATRSGAHVVGTPDDLRAELAPHGGADAVLDFVGADATIALGVDLLGPGGDLVVVGSGGGSLDFRKGALPQGVRVSAPFWGTAEELAAVVALARAGHLVPEVEVIGFDDVPAAYERLRRGGVLGRLVVDPRHTGPPAGSSVTTRGQGGR